MTRQPYRLRVADHAAVVLRTLHPNIKRKIKAALHAITADPFTGKALGDELSGLRSYRVSRFRIVYRLAHNNKVESIAIGPRERIYEETFRLISKDK
jgi:mRNA interferase RelE/StbE